MTPLLALASALIIGTADFSGGLATRRDSTFRVTSWTQLSSLATILALVWFVSWSEVTTTDLTAGAIAGISGGFSFACFYRALARGAMGAIAPTTAVVGAVIPAVVGFARGESLSGVATAGLFVAVGAIVMVTRTREARIESPSSTPPQALLLAVVAGIGFSVFFIALGETHDEAGLWPLVMARVVSVPLVALSARALTGSFGLARPARKLAVAAGTAEMVANVFLIEALRRGPLAIVSVVGSLYPISTALLARHFLGERLSRTQLAGLVAATAAVILVAF